MPQENKIPNEQVLLDNLGKIAYTLDRAYISQLADSYAVLPFDDNYSGDHSVDYVSNIRALKVDRWVFDKDEKIGDCFKNVLNLFADGDHTVALVIKRLPDHVEMYFVLKNEGRGRNYASRSNIQLLKSSLHGNFPGTHTEILDGTEAVQSLFSFKDAKSVAVLANSPAEYSKDYITQGIDKLLNGIVPTSDEDSYTVVLLADSLSGAAVREILSGYEDMATSIVPFAQYQFQMGKNKTDTQGEMKSLANTESTSNSIYKTHSVNIGLNLGLSNGDTKGTNEGENTGRTRSDTNTATKGVSAGVNGGVNLGIYHAGGNVAGHMAKSVAKTTAETAINVALKILSTTITKSIGLYLGYGYSWGSSKSISNGKTDTTGTSSSISIGESETTSYNYKSYMVVNMLEKLESVMKRIKGSQSTGLWKFSSYVLARDADTSKNVANFLRSLTQGKESYSESSAIQVWSMDARDRMNTFQEIRKYISFFTHPVFLTVKADEDGNIADGMFVTPTSYVATDELSNVFAFPRKPLQGVPVLECVGFGREPHSLTEVSTDIELGCGYHMRERVEGVRISLSKKELAKHTFITGSTGSGKSNAIYMLLTRLNDEGVKSLVIEPAKGEYRTAIAGEIGAAVYSTNPKIAGTRLLRINPFSFPSETHVLEHMDRLVEIFNVCWPMYAAMPAILKEAVERAYSSAGWDLIKSENRYHGGLFPSFADILSEIKTVLEQSDYSAENKGNYVGALVTRIRSLTNGINGMIFSSEDISDEELFDKNVIVDLSRVGSTETKALIMGLLILKLREHRMQSGSINADLHHVTVLEEAHNLLKRTSSEQVTEGANMLGKSVEMLANSIAEMRTYGEGFIIADQSPNLLDMSVIRNTNTKIILRLPDLGDRELAGRASALNDSQIIELARLEKGVASVHQSDWLEPVLCKVDLHDIKPEHAPTALTSETNITEEIKQPLFELILNELRSKGNKLDNIDPQKMADFVSRVVKSRIATSVKISLIEYWKSQPKEMLKKLGQLSVDFLNAVAAADSSKSINDIDRWVEHFSQMLTPSVADLPRTEKDLLIWVLLDELARRRTEYTGIFNRYSELMQLGVGKVVI